VATKLSLDTLVLSHANTDFDAFAGMLAAQLLYPGGRICLHGGVNRNVREFYNLHAEQIPSVEPSAVDRSSVKRLVLVEISEPARLGDFAGVAEQPGIEVVVFDHHGKSAFDRATTFIASDGSLVTNMLKLLLERGIQISPMQATAFALGIHEDTGSLTYSSTTHRDVEALAACLRAGANQELLARYLRGPLQPEQRELLRRLDAGRAQREIAGLRLITASARADGYIEDVSALVSRIGEVADWDVLVLSVAMERRVLLVGRSRTAAVAIDAAIEPLGGGGHAQAASAILQEDDPEVALERALDVIERVAKPPLRAGDVMSRPVHAVASADEIATALVQCQRLGLSGIQVSENGAITGVVAREDLDRAVRHGLSHAPVKAVMSAGVPVVGRQATIGELRDLLAGGSTERLIVVSDGPFRREDQVPAPHAEGVVTGGDVLRALHEPTMLERPAPDEEATEAVRARLGSIERLGEVLPAIQRVAALYDGVYLVGGAVRDVLLGEQSLDLDLMVEGDALSFAQELARELGVQSHPHEKFQTAVVKGVGVNGRELRVDVATARTEFYGAPGALPEIERSTLRHDLARRDFTINAMATSVKGEDLGATYDFFGGYHDLQRKTVRVLHNLSFVEDPTRLLRAIRYEARLGFRMDGHTLSLARGSIEARLLGELSSARLRDELLDILAEERVTAALARIAELHLDRAMHPRLNAGARAIRLVERADELLTQPPFGGEASTTLLRLAFLCLEMSADEVYEWLGKLRLRRDEQDIVAASVSVAPVLGDRLSRDTAASPSELRELLDGQPEEVLLMAVLLARDRARAEARVRAYLERIRAVRLEITGDDLKRAGARESPELGEALSQTLALKLDGFVSGREQELETALKILEKPALEKPALKKTSIGKTGPGKTAKPGRKLGLPDA
jgi:tRNA nucleotidyltransferase (CCA-adding enzyme)